MLQYEGSIDTLDDECPFYFIYPRLKAHYKGPSDLTYERIGFSNEPTYTTRRDGGEIKMYVQL